MEETGKVSSERKKRRVKFTRRFYALITVFMVSVLALIGALAIRGCGEAGRTGIASLTGSGLADLNRLKVNELGSVMVLEYHNIGEEGRWSRSPENFRKDLETLYNEGYRCISLKDFVQNNIKVAAGFTPVVFTFDDSTISQFRYIMEGNKPVIDPDCAVGIMEEFSRQHPDFNMTATFYVLPSLFGQDEYIEQKLKYLVEHGYDIGNHTYTHPALASISREKAVEEIARGIEMVRAYLPNYEMLSIALPLGSEPKDPSILVSGKSGEIEYNFICSLLVGAYPSPSPVDYNFNPMRMPRVQALALSLDSGRCGSEAWLQYFRENPERRYISDGDPQTVTVPKHMQPRVNGAALGDKKLRVY
jgi:hypothetical protein